MTIVCIDGFDLYNGVLANTGLLSKWTDNGGSASSIVAGRFGGQALQLNANTSNTSNNVRTLPASYASLSAGFAFRILSFAGNSDSFAHMIMFADSGTTQCSLRLLADGRLNVSRMTNPTSIAASLGTTASPIIVANTWHYVEVEVTISDTVGVFKVYVDGVQVLNLTGLDTKTSANATANQIQFYTAGAVHGSTLNDWNYDDLYVTDTATKLGECKVETCRPTADVSGATDFTPSTGSSHFALVDETTCNGDTDYNSGSTVGHKDRFTHAGLSTTPATIHAVQVTAFAQKTDATSRSIALQVKSGATTSDGANFALAVGYGKFDRIMETDPNTAAAWAVSPVNALEFGAKVTV